MLNPSADKSSAQDITQTLPIDRVQEIAYPEVEAKINWKRKLKRLLDFSLSLIGLILLSPLFLIVAALIKLDSPGPVFYRQTRVGKGGRLFTFYKFRSMKMNAEEMLQELSPLNEATGPLFKMRNDPRITRVGRFIRKTSIDELPQLWNVLKGEMSLVGPRPPVPREVEKYDDWQRKRLMVEQGITGLWQISGRSQLTFEEMVRLDIYYLENWSFWLDIKILLATIPAVLNTKGAF